ncbi:hypothetical protein BDW42DRAFT_164831 [Aspergillus taichungensis]|uniref:Uncharacterized protein n=1 Tax=Aspergillus taichungensis TaxID=482145 RepID=A0A2J5I0V0_9EURO|nr:hypothetical protein BDW42DRAFT_164831 [Aspergillus taichungensis]
MAAAIYAWTHERIERIFALGGMNNYCNGRIDPPHIQMTEPSNAELIFDPLCKAGLGRKSRKKHSLWFYFFPSLWSPYASMISVLSLSRLSLESLPTFLVINLFVSACLASFFF